MTESQATPSTLCSALTVDKDPAHLDAESSTQEEAIHANSDGGDENNQDQIGEPIKSDDGENEWEDYEEDGYEVDDVEEPTFWPPWGLLDARANDEDQVMPEPWTELPPLTRLHTTWNPQFQSSLFCKLPPELRALVFLWALMPYQDTSAPGVPFNSYGYRPETAFPIVQSVALLRTCRRIYLETHAVPVSLRTFTSWRLVWDRRCPYERAVGPRFTQLSTTDILNVRYFHIYAQQCQLENSGWAQRATQIASNPIPSIQRLTVTIRHSDFYFWETDQPLRMDTSNRRYGDDWRRGLDHFPNLEVFVFELETLERRKAELDVLVQQVKQWKITLKDGRVLSTDGQPLERHTWLGSPAYHGGQQPAPGTTALSYYVTKIIWKAPPAVLG